MKKSIESRDVAMLFTTGFLSIVVLALSNSDMQLAAVTASCFLIKEGYDYTFKKDIKE